MSEGLVEREEEVIKIVKAFSKKPAELIDGITIEDLTERGGINPYFVRSLGLQTIDEVVEFFLLRRVERSLGTSFGTVLEKFIRALLDGKDGKDLDPGCKKRGVREKPWICWWDVVLDRPFNEGEKAWQGVVISVKSGPADMDKDQVEHFAGRAVDAESKGYRPYLTLVYGKVAWSVITQTLTSKGLTPDRYMRVGKGIFQEFLGDSGYYNRALEIFSEGGLQEDLFTMIEQKKEELVRQLKEKYGDDLEDLLKDAF